jgi:dTDP-glucose pyrophosphorylase
MINPTLIVMAAGSGTRYGGLKQIDPIGPDGETIIDYSVFDAMRAGFRKVVFVIRRDIERQFREAIGYRLERMIEVEYVFQDLESLPGLAYLTNRKSHGGQPTQFSSLRTRYVGHSALSTAMTSTVAILFAS